MRGRVDRRPFTREICRRSYYDFFIRAWHVVEPQRDLLDNWHIKYCCDLAQAEIERIARKREKDHDYIINMPFRALKSMIFSVMLQPWAWIDYPWMRFCNYSYGSGLSLSHSNKSQKIMDSAWYRDHFADSFSMRSSIRGNSKLKETERYFENDRGGYRFVSSVTGGSTGYGGDVNVGDDLIKAQAAQSEAERKRANTFWWENVPSRVEDFDMAVFFLIMQRVHDDDPTGYGIQRNESGGGIFHVVLPAEDIGNVHPRGLRAFYKDGLFFPERFSRKVIDRFKSPAGIGVKATAAQLNQNPVKPGGNLFQESWFIRRDRDQVPPRRKFEKIRRYWDTAFTDDEKNSACAFIEMGLLDRHVWILNLEYRWVEFPQQIRWIQTSPPDVVHKVEAKATGKSTVQVLRDNKIAAQEVQVDAADKRARGNAISMHIEGGKVSVPEFLWDALMHDSRQGLLKFPDGSHSDLGDAFVIGITDLLGVPDFGAKELDTMIETDYSSVF